MASRPVDSFALAAPHKCIMGFPDIVGYQTIDPIFRDLVNGKVAVNASGKRLDIVLVNADLDHNLFELLNEKIGGDENEIAAWPRFLDFFTSCNEYSRFLEPDTKFPAGNFRFVNGVIPQNTEPFG